MTNLTHPENGRIHTNKAKGQTRKQRLPQRAKRPLPAVRTPNPLSIPKRPPSQINIPPQKRPYQRGTLSYYLERGRHMHPLCRDSFIERVEIGYYHYERRTEWRTCAIAATYAGAFGARSVERPDFSYSMAIWQLSSQFSIDLKTCTVYGPTSRHQPVCEEMIQLIDKDGWTRAGIAQWLHSINL